MRSHRPKSRVLLAGAALLSLLTVPGPAPADVYFETVYVPTSSVVTVPTSSVLATSYVVPSSYVSTTYLPTSYTTSSYIPTSYTTSSYIPTSYTTSSYIPTSYTSTLIPTSSVVSTDSVLVPTTTTYYRPSIFRSRRFYERTSYSYVPTTYSTILPTTYYRSSLLPTAYLVDDSVVTTSMASNPCDTSPSVAPTRAVNKAPSNGNGPVVTSEPTNAGMSNERRPTSNFNNTPSNEEGPSSRVNPPVTLPPTTTTPPPPAPKDNKPVDTGAAMPEPPVAGETAAPKVPPGTGGPALPAPGAIGAPATPPNELQFRESRRPTYDMRNILKGRVVSSDSKRTEEGIMVILSNVNKTFTDRQAMTDADGEFKVSLPDGDWVVKVRMPSGSIVPVGKEYVTASNGKVTDASGRLVYEVTITR